MSLFSSTPICTKPFHFTAAIQIGNFTYSIRWLICSNNLSPANLQKSQTVEKIFNNFTTTTVLKMLLVLVLQINSKLILQPFLRSVGSWYLIKLIRISRACEASVLPEIKHTKAVQKSNQNYSSVRKREEAYLYIWNPAKLIPHLISLSLQTELVSTMLQFACEWRQASSSTSPSAHLQRLYKLVLEDFIVSG